MNLLTLGINSPTLLVLMFLMILKYCFRVFFLLSLFSFFLIYSTSDVDVTKSSEIFRTLMEFFNNVMCPGIIVHHLVLKFVSCTLDSLHHQ